MWLTSLVLAVLAQANSAAQPGGTSLSGNVVGPDGKPREPKVVRSLGLGLDEKAMEAVSQWKFEPALKDGKPVAVAINVEVQFRLY